MLTEFHDSIIYIFVANDDFSLVDEILFKHVFFLHQTSRSKLKVQSYICNNQNF